MKSNSRTVCERARFGQSRLECAGAEQHVWKEAPKNREVPDLARARQLPARASAGCPGFAEHRQAQVATPENLGTVPVDLDAQWQCRWNVRRCIRNRRLDKVRKQARRAGPSQALLSPVQPELRLRGYKAGRSRCLSAVPCLVAT